MRVLVVTAGSRGDVAPFTGLARRLQDAGHQVAVAAYARFGDLLRDCGLEHRVQPGDPAELARARLAAPTPEAARSVFLEHLQELGDGLIAAVGAGTDLVLTAFGPAPLSRLVADGFGIPSVGTYLVPSVPTAAFPLPGHPGGTDLGPAGNLAAGQAQVAGAGALYAEVLPRVAARLDLPATASGAWPVCHGVSPSVVPRPDDWPAEVTMSGYWWSARPSGWVPAPELVDFLDAGEAPVLLGFGSMTPSDAQRFSALVDDAVRQAGVRAVVQAGWAGLTPVGDDVLVVDDVPHDWLFPRTAAVVHHAGAGTTAAALRAGKPAVAVPVVLDQPFWADRLHRLGVAPPPLPETELTAGTLAAAIRRCLDEPSFAHRAAELATAVGAEDGAAAVVAMVERLAG